ncbi:uncharacterized protein MONBRDRAFT_16686 [Monosiga brevicollis MX1]|uniref:Uncharacterized protein n=1 Tax=Monosiga brevicollis TaxID=81824 RepID=A9UXK8_MONBE|nr:uncharacterized protein MONBRDRAFT_16686 [Monosiga brevicollis MX1]EDQ89859.1 predicted protein [Monosiga brevicollis MX1]|eukprot:XP_001745281.1 hypothetical protein [Monosiga brevicollis MX1]
MQAESLVVPKGSARQYTSFTRTLTKIAGQEGLWVLWGSGIVSACYRDVFYSSIRYGAYPIVKNLLFPSSPGSGDIGLTRKWVCGVLTGGFGAALANPSDIVMIRMKAEAGRIENNRYVTGLYQGRQPRYKNGFEGLIRLLREEGIRAAYKGTSATAARAALGTGAQVASYDHCKYLCKKHNVGPLGKEGLPLHVFSAFVAGICFTTCAAPADIIKSQYMAETGRFKSVLDCAVQLVRTEGAAALFRGWTPAAMRLCPLFMLMTPILEQCRKAVGLGWFAV